MIQMKPRGSCLKAQRDIAERHEGVTNEVADVVELYARAEVQS